MNIFQQTILWLEGKKVYISALALLIIPFAESQGLSKEWGELLMGIVAILMGGGKVYADASANDTSLPNNLGLAIREKRNLIN
jgi:hypothetical protein